MRKSAFIPVIILSVLSWGACQHGSKKEVAGESGISFDSVNYDFGEVPFNGDANVEFVFTNTGKAPLLVTHVKSTCGCTIPTWSKEPVKSGKHGSIHVSYDTHRVGAFNKSIYVYSNAANGVQRLSISGKVNRSSADS